MNKVAIVTGGTRGIGLGIVKSLLQDGYNVSIVATRRNDNLNILFAEYDESLKFIQANIADSIDRDSIVKQTIERFGRIDVLVNNAGVAPKQRLDILDMTEESMDYVCNINLKGTFFLTQLVAKYMMKQPEVEYKLKIVNISSISSYTSSTSRGEYCISKAGISMITKLFADRLANNNINVYEIRPGIIKTDMTEKVSAKYDKLIKEGLTPIRRWGEPEDIGNIVSVVCSNKMDFCTGEVINADGGFHIRRL